MSVPFKNNAFFFVLGMTFGHAVLWPIYHSVAGADSPLVVLSAISLLIYSLMMFRFLLRNKTGTSINGDKRQITPLPPDTSSDTTTPSQPPEPTQ